MHPTKINKAMSVFVSGGTALVFILTIIFWNFERPFSYFSLRFNEVSSAVWPVIAGLSFISVAGFLGLIIEGVSDVTVRRFLYHSLNTGRECVMCMLLQTDRFKKYSKWLNVCNLLFEENQTSDIKFKFRGSEDFASVLLFKSRNSPAIEWATFHYATFTLAANYGLLSILMAISSAVVAAFSSRWDVMWIILLIGAVVTWAFLSYAMNQVIYTYTFAFKYYCFSLWEPDPELNRHEVPISNAPDAP